MKVAVKYIRGGRVVSNMPIRFANVLQKMKLVEFVDGIPAPVTSPIYATKPMKADVEKPKKKTEKKKRKAKEAIAEKVEPSLPLSVSNSPVPAEKKEYKTKVMVAEDK